MRNDYSKIRILSIETSCDETAAAVIGVENGKPVVLSSIISSSADLHAKTGGIVPEVASRAQMEAMLPVVELALQQANSKFKIQNLKLRDGNSQNPDIENSKLKIENSSLLDDITHVAVTNGPGLIGSLLVGFNAAKTIAYARKLPFIPINHIEGHIYSVDIQKFEFPILSLTVSGGHTSLTVMRDHGAYETIGETIDDAAGEAFDKVAKLLDLGYPGGPAVSRLAQIHREKIVELPHCSIAEKTIEQSNNRTINFPRPLINQPNFNFSFSGLKTAVLTAVLKLKADSQQLTADQKAELCWAFEEAAVEVLCVKAIKAARKYRPKGIILAGGVAANRRLQEELKNRIDKYNDEVEEKYKLDFYTPGRGMAGDNAAMIGLAAYYHIKKDNIPELFGTTVDSNLELK